MDISSIPTLSDEPDLQWSDNHSMSSDDSAHGATGFSQSPPTRDPISWMPAMNSPTLPTGQLSPVSNEMEVVIPQDGLPHSVVLPGPSPSSRTTSWNTDDMGDNDSGGSVVQSQNSNPNESRVIPKLEPLDDDFSFNDVTNLPPNPDESPCVSPTQQKQKRPRGRPRKHPLTPTASTSKITKGRSKTGCITCRKRKKKCDEAKPRCMNCEKNAVVCEGYHEKKLWKSGKEKINDDFTTNEDPLVFNMQPLFHGVVSIEDRIFWKHYYVNLSNVLTVEGEARNAFKDIILPLANIHQGVMHSVLAMSSKHIDYNTPYGAKVLLQHPTTTREKLEERSIYHHKEAMASFYEDMRCPGGGDAADAKTILAAQYAQILCRLIGTLIDGNPHGEHRVHLRGYQRLIVQTPPEDPALHTFIREFFQYHIYADELLWHPAMGGPRLTGQDSLPTSPIEPPRLMGVADGLLQHVSHIATIRDTIRTNVYNGAETKVDYHLLWRAQEIQEAIELWAPSWPVGDSRHRVGLIYKHMMFLHLFRTIYPPTVPPPRPAFSSSLASTRVPASPAASRRPSHSRPLTASSRSSSPGPDVPTATMTSTAFQQHSPPGSRNPSRTSSMHESDPGGLSARRRPVSPPPIRRPLQQHQDGRITAAVEESLALMEGFKPSDPALTLLLIPCQVIGVACFDPSQQDRIRAIIRQVRGYTGLRNCDRVVEILEEVWRLMDCGDWMSVWDWQAAARDISIDCLCA